MAGHIHDWSTTAASNNTADSTVNWAEGQLPGTVNDSARAMMAAQASWIKDNGGTVTTSGSAGVNAYTATINEGITAYSTGMTAVLTANFTCTASPAPTLNINGIGAKAIRKFTAAGEGPVGSGQIKANAKHFFFYDSTANSSSGGWLCLNPIRTMTTQLFTTGSGTYTTPAGATTIVVELVGGGGGGGSGNNDATNGGNTLFSTMVGTGGVKGASATAGDGGLPTGGDINITGSPGGAGSGGITGTYAGTGGSGGPSHFGSGAAGQYNASPSTAPAGGGGGGGGAYNGTGTSIYSGAGGGAGGYCFKLFSAPAATYTYSIGAGGTGATSASNITAGSNGGVGFIKVVEYYD